jgi:curved DNA-binding protein CbpA
VTSVPELDWRGADAFMVLGLPYSAELTDRDVRAAYLRRMRAVHPDAGGDAEAAQAVQAAYEALRSGVRRGEQLAALMTDRDTRLGTAYEPGTGNVPDAARREELRRRVTASRAAQGLPPYITDPAVLDRIADLLMVTLGRADRKRRAHPRPLSAAGPRRDDRPAGAGYEPSVWRRETRRRFDAGRIASVSVASARQPARAWARVRYGRPGWLAVRVLIAVGAVAGAALAAPGDPAVPAVGVGAGTWLLLSGRRDLAPLAGRDADE